MAWETSDRKAFLPDNWTQLRASILARAGGRCEVIKKNGRRCFDKPNAVDHIIPHAEGGTDEVANLQAICPWHHQKKSSAEGGRGSQRSYAKMRESVLREPEKHPGLIDKSEAVPRANRGF